MTETQTVTQLLRAWRGGDREALDRLMPLVYEELHRLASRSMRGERSDHTLQTTALVHEAYLRLAGAEVEWRDRVHFFATAARVMRRILVDHAKAKRRRKRGGGAKKVSLDQVALVGPEPPQDLLALDEALSRLEARDERKCRVVECRFFAGMTHEETAAALGVSPATVDRELRMAKAWLSRELS
jgi:RNA polymerase sigma factor (TIGR02999 family)